ncbi:hypothetical protein HMPREF9374_4035, partial [Desmospora sp. 8437]
LYRHEILSPPARAGEGRISAVNCRQMAGGPNVEAITQPAVGEIDLGSIHRLLVPFCDQKA